MKLVVTGALGYLGASLIRKLPAQFPQSKIILLDNLSTGQAQALQNLPQKGSYSFFESDIRNFNFEKLKLTAKDAVIHLAGLSRAGESYKNSNEFVSVNTEGALRVAKACAETSTAFFFPSTTSVYHEVSGKTIPYVFSNLRPQTPYADSKLKAERGFKKIKGLRYTVIRFGTIYGVSPVMTYQTAVNKFCWQAGTGQPITVWKTALHQWRPYLEIDDAMRLILFFIKNYRFSGETFNAATQHARVSDILNAIKTQIPKTKIIKTPSRVMNSLSYKINAAPIAELGFRFKGDLRESMRGVLRSLPEFS